MSAQQICDGTLDTNARTALERISGTKRFSELSGKNEASEPKEFSTTRAVKHLHDEPTQRSKCSIYKTSGENDFPIIEIQFLAAKQHPEPLEEATNNLVPFPLGSYAAVGKNGADLYFECTTSGTEESFIGDTPYVKAEMFSPSFGSRDPRDRMVILNSISRAVASKAGCASQADLPVEVPTV
ncbi:hypothetical protein [Streptomyces sp. TRM70350]|uniref:hypothetical protein n=1 Tax=Streptomyces sp. TRM70350 TaxID=2856165 RepID=UPI001C48BFBE|nr:hypothetical protein [Streptomyces sp. TRM70350]MBV7698093.1 hypothetical protein [Streptomyces sp. TRM70350]